MPSRKVECSGKWTLRIVVAERAEATSKNCLTRTKKIVGSTYAGGVKERSGACAGQRDTSVTLIPEKSSEVTQIGGIITVLGLVENGQPDPLPIIPGAEVSKAKSVFQSQARRRFPTVLTVELQRPESDIVEHILGAFPVCSHSAR